MVLDNKRNDFKTNCQPKKENEGNHNINIRYMKNNNSTKNFMSLQRNLRIRENSIFISNTNNELENVEKPSPTIN